MNELHTIHTRTPLNKVGEGRGHYSHMEREKETRWRTKTQNQKIWNEAQTVQAKVSERRVSSPF